MTSDVDMSDGEESPTLAALAGEIGGLVESRKRKKPPAPPSNAPNPFAHMKFGRTSKSTRLPRPKVQGFTPIFKTNSRSLGENRLDLNSAPPLVEHLDNDLTTESADSFLQSGEDIPPPIPITDCLTASNTFMIQKEVRTPTSNIPYHPVRAALFTETTHHIQNEVATDDSNRIESKRSLEQVECLPEDRTERVKVVMARTITAQGTVGGGNVATPNYSTAKQQNTEVNNNHHLSAEINKTTTSTILPDRRSIGLSELPRPVSGIWRLAASDYGEVEEINLTPSHNESLLIPNLINRAGPTISSSPHQELYGELAGEIWDVMQKYNKRAELRTGVRPFAAHLSVGGQHSVVVRHDEKIEDLRLEVFNNLINPNSLTVTSLAAVVACFTVHQICEDLYLAIALSLQKSSEENSTTSTVNKTKPLLENQVIQNQSLVGVTAAVVKNHISEKDNRDSELSTSASVTKPLVTNTTVVSHAAIGVVQNQSSEVNENSAPQNMKVATVKEVQFSTNEEMVQQPESSASQVEMLAVRNHFTERPTPTVLMSEAIPVGESNVSANEEDVVHNVEPPSAVTTNKRTPIVQLEHDEIVLPEIGTEVVEMDDVTNKQLSETGSSCPSREELRTITSDVEMSMTKSDESLPTCPPPELLANEIPSVVLSQSVSEEVHTACQMDVQTAVNCADVVMSACPETDELLREGSPSRSESSQSISDVISEGPIQLAQNPNIGIETVSDLFYESNDGNGDVQHPNSQVHFSPVRPLSRCASEIDQHDSKQVEAILEEDLTRISFTVSEGTDIDVSQQLLVESHPDFTLQRTDQLVSLCLKFGIKSGTRDFMISKLNSVVAAKIGFSESSPTREQLTQLSPPLLDFVSKSDEHLSQLCDTLGIRIGSRSFMINKLNTIVAAKNGMSSQVLPTPQAEGELLDFGTQTNDQLSQLCSNFGIKPGSRSFMINKLSVISEAKNRSSQPQPAPQTEEEEILDFGTQTNDQLSQLCGNFGIKTSSRLFMINKLNSITEAKIKASQPQHVDNDRELLAEDLRSHREEEKQQKVNEMLAKMKITMTTTKDFGVTGADGVDLFTKVLQLLYNKTNSTSLSLSMFT